MLGEYSNGGTPTYIPNLEVKPIYADGTWLEAAWESMDLPSIVASLAQSVEHAAVNRSVNGSSPLGSAILNSTHFISVFSLFMNYAKTLTTLVVRWYEICLILFLHNEIGYSELLPLVEVGASWEVCAFVSHIYLPSSLDSPYPDIFF